MSLADEGREALAGTIRAFVASNRRDRWLADLDRPEKRAKTVRLYDTRDFDSRFVTPVPKGTHSREGVATLLRGHGSPEQVWLLFEGDLVPRRLDEALAEIIRPGYGEALVICLAGTLAYLETEAQGGFVLKR